MICSFDDKGTEDIYHGSNTKQARSTLPINLHLMARRKLDMMEAALVLDDLKMPPGNRLESLSGNLKGNYSIRINNQWRIVFGWCQLGATDVKIQDYH